MLKHRRAPSPALVISLIALFVALGSGAYAASQIGTSDIQKKAVTGSKIASDAIKSSKVKNEKLKGKDLKDETIGGSKIEDEAIGGSKLSSGAVSASKLGEITEETDTTIVPDQTIGTAQVDCPTGTKVISGGFTTDSVDTPPARVGIAIENLRDNNGWRASIFATGNDTKVQVFAYCLENGD